MMSKGYSIIPKVGLLVAIGMGSSISSVPIGGPISVGSSIVIDMSNISPGVPSRRKPTQPYSVILFHLLIMATRRVTPPTPFRAVLPPGRMALPLTPCRLRERVAVTRLRPSLTRSPASPTSTLVTTCFLPLHDPPYRSIVNSSNPSRCV